MVNQQEVQGNWNELKGKINQKWGQLTDDDLREFSGNIDQLIGMIQRKTGETRDAIVQYLDHISENASGAVERASAYAGQAAERLQDASARMRENVRAGYEDAERTVRQHPAESLAASFGAGLIAGVVVGLLLRSR